MANPIQTPLVFNEIVSQQEARAQGLRWYFTGKPCKYGHIAERGVSHGVCRECNRLTGSNADKRVYRAEWAKQNKEKLQAYLKKYRAEKKDKLTAQIREWKKAHPKSHAEHKKRQSEGRRQRMIAKAGRPQPDACEICSKATDTLCFDHCHQTEEFRGWLCQQCNTALGMVQDSPEILRRLAAYLERS